LPDIADHLPAADGTVAGPQRAHVDRAVRAIVEVGASRCGGAVSPGEAPLAPGRRLRRGGHLPLRLGRQAPARPPAPCLGFIPVDVHHGMAGLEAGRRAEPALVPAVTAVGPDERMLGPLAAPPVPATAAPQLAAAIPPGVH